MAELERLLGFFREVIVGLIWRVILPLFLKLIWRRLRVYLEHIWSCFGAYFLDRFGAYFLGRFGACFQGM